MKHIERLIDHTLIRPDAVFGEYTVLIREAVKYNFKSVCVPSFFVPLVSNLLENHPTKDIKVCSVVAFPHGLSDIHTKSLEIERAISKGAHEIDAVVNISAVKSHDWKRVQDELVELREASDKHIFKLILEVAALSDDEIKKCCELAVACDLNFVKTSTGFYKELKPTETARYVKLMSDSVRGSRVEVKASGWIRTLDDLNLMLDAGATRVGCSKSLNIMKELRGE